jgi:hypothetical protein
MSMTQDAGSFFRPLNYTTSFTNPAQYNMGQLGGIQAQGQQGFDASIHDIEYTQKLFQHYYEQSLFGVANQGLPAPPGTYGEGGLDPGGSQGLGYKGDTAPWSKVGWDGGGGGQYSYNAPNTGIATINNQDWYNSLQGPGWGGGIGGGGSLDWSKVGQAVGGLYPSSQSPFDFNAGAGASMFGGLGGAGAQPGAGLDWTKLYQGGAKTDPYPNMAMPDGPNQSMAQPQARQQPIDYGSLFGQAVGGKGGAPPSVSETAPAPMPGAAEQGAGMFGGLGGVGGPPGQAMDFTRLFGGKDTQGAPQATPQVASQAQPQQQPIDFGSLFGRVAGGTGQQRPVSAEGGDTFNDRFNAIGTGGLGARPATEPPPSGTSAADMAGAARDRLAGLLNPYDRPSLEEFQQGQSATTSQAAPIEGEAGRGGMVDRPGAVPGNPLYDQAEGERLPLTAPAMPRARPAAEPPADVSDDPRTLAGRQALIRNTLAKELQAQGLEVTSTYRDPSDPLSKANPNSAHTRAEAFDVRAKTPEQADAAIARIKELMGARGLVLGTDYKILDEVRNPSAWATGPHVHTQFLPEGMAKYQQNVYQDPENIVRPPASIPSTGTPQEQRQFDQPPRPPGELSLSNSPVLRGVDQRLVRAVEGGATFLPPGYSVEAVSGTSDRQKDTYGAHKSGNALDVKIRGPDGLIPHEGEDTTGMYTLLARGAKTWAQQNDPQTAAQMSYGGAFGTRGGKPGEVPDLMHYDLWGSRGQMRPDVQFGNLKPLTEAERNQMPAYIPLLGANQVPIEGRIATGSGTRAPVAPMMFGGEFGGVMGGELPTSPGWGPFQDFRPGATFENRTAEMLPDDQLAALRARGFGYDPNTVPEVAPSPLGWDLGLRLPAPGSAPAAAMARPQGAVGDKEAGGLDFNALWNDRAGAVAAEPVDERLPQSEVNDVFKQYLKQVPAFDVQRELQGQRAPFWNQLQSNPRQMDQFLALINSEMTQQNSPEAQQERIAFAETPANRFSAWGADAFPTASGTSHYLSSPLGTAGTAGDYYEPIRPGGTIGTSLTAVQNNPELRDRLAAAVRQAMLGGSNFSNFGLENSLRGSDIGNEALRTQALASHMPITNEDLTQKILPQFDTEHVGPSGHGAGDVRTFLNWVNNLKGLGAGYDVNR